MRLDRGALVGRQRAVEALTLVAFVGEGLDHLVIDQAVDRGGAELVVALVHLAPEPRAPVGGEDGEARIGGDGGKGDGGERDRVAGQQDAQDQHELEDGRAEIEQPGLQDEAHRLHAALDGTAELAGAALQMVAERQREQMLVDRQRHLPAGPFADLGEDVDVHHVSVTDVVMIYHVGHLGARAKFTRLRLRGKDRDL